MQAESYLGLNEVALLKDLDNSILLLGAAELGLKGALGGGIESALVTVANMMLALMFHCMCTIALAPRRSRWRLGLLVGNEDLEAVDDLSKGDALVLLPVLDSLAALDEDDEVLALALVVAPDLSGVSAHVGCGGWVVVGWIWWCVGCGFAGGFQWDCTNWMVCEREGEGGEESNQVCSFESEQRSAMASRGSRVTRWDDAGTEARRELWPCFRRHTLEVKRLKFTFAQAPPNFVSNRRRA